MIGVGSQELYHNVAQSNHKPQFLLQSCEQPGRSSVVSSVNKKPVRGSPKASSARELIEKKGIGNKEEKASTLPRKGTIFAKKESGSGAAVNGGRKVSTLPRNRDTRDSGDSSEDSLRGQGDTETGSGDQVTRWHSLESVGDITADTSMDYIEFSSQTLPRSYKAEVIKSEWAELMESSSAALAEEDMFHTLPRYSGRVKQVLTVQEKLEDTARPPPAELYVNLLEDDEDGEGGVAESDADTASMSTGTVSHRPTPHITPHHSFSGADKTRPIDIAKMLDPFEALEREFGWEGGVTIRPPSAFCSLADIQEDSDEKFGDTDTENTVSDPVKSSEISEVMAAVDEAVNSLDDSGVCDVSDVSISEERDAGQDVR